jgi:lipopolysaccharide transport system permease protein
MSEIAQGAVPGTEVAELSAPPLTRLPTAWLDLTANMSFVAHSRLAIQDLLDGLRLWRLATTLGWLDIRLRYRGSMLGPFWLTLSTAVMVGALGFLYSALFVMDLRTYLPFLTLSLVLWNCLAGLVGDACLCISDAEGIVRSVRLPFTIHAIRCLVRNGLVLGHNVIVVVAVFAIFSAWPGPLALLSIPALLLWVVDAVAAALLLGSVCARFRDVPPIVGSVVQIAFFVSAIIWKPEQIGGRPIWLQGNPFFSIIEVVRAPILGDLPSHLTYASAVGWSALLCLSAGIVFARARGRLAFWV